MGGSDTFLTARFGFVGDFGVAGGVLFRYIEVVKAWSWKAKYGGCKHEYIWNFEYGDENIKWGRDECGVSGGRWSGLRTACFMTLHTTTLGPLCSGHGLVSKKSTLLGRAQLLFHEEHD